MSARTIPLLRQDGRRVSNYPLLLLGVMQYPNCIQSAKHFWHIVGDDEETTPGWRSSIGQVIHKDALGRKRQGHITGQVFLSLIEGVAHGQSVSMNGAYYLAKPYAKTHRIEDGERFSPASTRGIRDAFKNFKDVGHFWATQVIFPEVFTSIPKDEEAAKTFLAVSMDIHDDIVASTAFPEWDPWIVPSEMRPLNRVLKVPPLSDEKLIWPSEYNSEIGR